MVNYNNGKIYKIEPICEHDEGDIYIGSTTKQYLSQRMDKHRSDYKRWLSGKCNNIMSFNLFEKYNINNCQIVLLESVHANTKDELTSREAFYIRTRKCVNKYIPNRTKPEYDKTYYGSNKEFITGRNKHYREQNKEHIAKHNKQYYEENKDKIRQNQNTRCTCLWGGCYTIASKSRHIKSIKHQNYVNSQVQYEYHWLDGTPCSEQEYYDSII